MDIRRHVDLLLETGRGLFAASADIMQRCESAVQDVIEKIKDGTLALEQFEATLSENNHLVTLATEVMSLKTQEDFQSIFESRKSDCQLYNSLVSGIPRAFENQVNENKGMRSKIFTILNYFKIYEMLLL